MKTISIRFAAALLCLHLAACGTVAEPVKKARSTPEQIKQAKELNQILREQQDRDRVLNNARGMR